MCIQSAQYQLVILNALIQNAVKRSKAYALKAPYDMLIVKSKRQILCNTECFVADIRPDLHSREPFARPGKLQQHGS